MFFNSPARTVSINIEHRDRAVLFLRWIMNELTLTYAQLVHKLVYAAYWRETLYGRQAVVERYSFERISREIEDRLTMAKKVTGQGAISKPEFTSVKWVNRQLTSEEKEQHDSGNLSPEKAFRDLLALSLQGYNISLKWDAYSSCFQASIMPYNQASPNYGYAISARASEPFRALSLLMFKHYEVLQEDWQQAYKPTSNSYEG